MEDRIDLLAQGGPSLGRPAVGTISGSRIANLKELRASGRGLQDLGGSLRITRYFDGHEFELKVGDLTGTETDTVEPVEALEGVGREPA